MQCYENSNVNHARKRKILIQELNENFTEIDEEIPVNNIEEEIPSKDIEE